MENRQVWRVGEETRVAAASPEAGTLASGAARRPLRDDRSSGGVPTRTSLPQLRRRFPEELNGLRTFVALCLPTAVDTINCWFRRFCHYVFENRNPLENLGVIGCR